MRLIEYDPSCDHKQLEFFIEMKFTGPQQFRKAVQMYAVENGRNIRWKRNDALKMEVRCVVGCYWKVCVVGCYWKVYASWLQDRLSFVIKSVYPIHKCGRSLTNKQATAKWVGTKYLKKFRNNPTWSFCEMEDDLKESFGLIVRSMCYKARVKTLHILRRTLEEHYCDAPKSGGLLTNRQPSKNLWMLGNPIPHYCVPFTRIHNLTKIG